MKDSEKHFLLVHENDSGERLDKYISGQFPSFARSYIQKLLKDGKITVSQKAVKASYKIKTGDEISITIPPAVDPEILPEDIPLDILYEDSELLIVNKPKNMVVHPSAGHYEHTLVNAVLFHCQGELSGINGVMRPGIVHRIDKDTTGALIVCKTDLSHEKIAEQLKVHSSVRKYRAIVHGRLRNDGVIDLPIGRHPIDRKKMAVNYKNGKSAVTHYHILETFQKYTYLECQLETGRTHQIRVHMSHMGHPILGDEVYGPSKCPISNLEGQTLHAEMIGFLHPKTGKYMEFHAPLPDYFVRLLQIL